MMQSVNIPTPLVWAGVVFVAYLAFGPGVLVGAALATAWIYSGKGK